MLKKQYSKTKPVCKVTFSLPIEAARGGKDVRILGDFNHWSWEQGYCMSAGKTEYTAEVELSSGREYQFRYLIDNHIWENDWKADRYTPAAYGEYNSVLSLIQNAPGKKEPVLKEAEEAKAKKPASAKAAKPKVAAPKKTSATTEAKPAAAPKTAVKKPAVKKTSTKK